jgi:hypothetical protein
MRRESFEKCLTEDTVIEHVQKIIRQAGAELCQAQAQVSLPAEAELILRVEF